MAIARLSVKVGKAGKAAPHAEYIDRDEEKKLKQEQEQEQEKRERRASPLGSRLPPDWTLPDEWRTWAEHERPDVDVALEAAKFRDFWHGKPGKDGRKADWQATWRNWVRRAEPGRRRASPAAGDDFLARAI